jgi:Ca2+-binding RTX toxin-like protein
LIGNDGDDVLNGRGGDDYLEGGAGADSFIFEDRFGRDVVEDFQAEFDFVDLTSFGFNAFEDLTVTQVGDDAVISLSGHEQITLRDLDVDLLTDQNVLV